MSNNQECLNFEREGTKVKRKGLRRLNNNKKLRSPQTLLKTFSEHDDINGCLLWDLPIRLESPNKQMHWRTKHKINKEIHKKLLYLMPKAIDKVTLPCTIYICRVAPRKFDYDNLVFSTKFVRDTIADFLIPGLASGRADADERITWHYEQTSAGVGLYGLRIEIIYTPDTSCL